MSNNETNSEDSLKLVFIRIPLWKWNKWKASADRDGKSLNKYVINKVDESENPICPNQDNIAMIQLTNKIDAIQTELTQMFENERKQILEQCALPRDTIPGSQKIQEKIIAFLKQAPTAMTEYMIAYEIKEDADIIMTIMPYLEKLGKVQQDSELLWELTPKEKKK